MTQQHTVASSGTFWAWVPATLLGAMLLGLGTMAYIAIDDPSFALEPNYYDKAVHWDRSQAEARSSQALGLRLSLLQPPQVSAQGEVELVLGVRDRQDLPVQGAAVELEAFPNAFAARLQQISLQEASPGVYRARLSQGVGGLWELRFKVTQGASRFRQVLRVDVSKGGAA
jgi:nitrogen fixation protein FixH